MQETELIARMRAELGDLGTPFQDLYTGTGEQSYYDLSESSISAATLRVNVGGVTRTLVEGTDYQLLAAEGRVILLGALDPLPQGAALVVSGQASGMFLTEELEVFAREAVRMHCDKRFTSTRVKDAHGFIEFVDTPMSLENLPEIEELPLTLLAVANALWSLATDAASDVDITTVEGTHVPRSQRFEQLMAMIDAVTARYRDYCQQQNIGFWRIEMVELRRVSRTTSRLIPIYREREYDDYGKAVRQLPPLDHRNDDDSQIPNPGFGGGWW